MSLKAWLLVLLTFAGTVLAGFLYGRLERSAGPSFLIDWVTPSPASSTFDTVAAAMTDDPEVDPFLRQGKRYANGLIVPASGYRAHRFGDLLSDGTRADWIALRTEAGARVVAPAAGTIEYARPFRSFGNLIILRTEDARHIILSGLGRIAVQEGQIVDQGEFVGDMPSEKPRPVLTLELRQGEWPVDPET